MARERNYEEKGCLACYQSVSQWEQSRSLVDHAQIGSLDKISKRSNGQQHLQTHAQLFQHARCRRIGSTIFLLNTTCDAWGHTATDSKFQS